MHAVRLVGITEIPVNRLVSLAARIIYGVVMDTDFQIEGFAPGERLAGRRIVVAMSGGVDSSVVAALAASSGAETIGITLQLYDHGAATGRTGSCCAGQDIRDARAVCRPAGDCPLCL